MGIVDAIKTGKPFRRKGQVAWLLFTTNPYPWLMYAECKTWLKSHSIVEYLFDDGGISSEDYEVMNGG